MHSKGRVISVVVAVVCAGCGDPAATVPTSLASASAPPAAADDGLPGARNVEALFDGAPTIVVDAERITLDGAALGDVQKLAAIGRLNKVDAEFDALEAKREAWKAAHPGADFPGVAQLRMHRATKALVAKSVFQTAAFAGYPNLSFVVEDGAAKPGGARLARINVDALVPGPPDPSNLGPPSELTLFVRVVPSKSVVLSWKRGDELISEVEVPSTEAFERDGEELRAPGLAARLAREWSAQGAHRDPSDKKLDRAIVLLDDTADVRDLVAVLDALAQTKRDVAGLGRLPVFNTALSMVAGAPANASASGDKPRIALGATTVNGRLPPEVIQRIVRKEFSKLRACYEAGLQKDPKLGGKVSVRFVIGSDGKVSSSTDAGSDLPNAGVVQCVVKAFGSLAFPAPEGGKVTVVYPIQFSP